MKNVQHAILRPLLTCRACSCAALSRRLIAVPADSSSEINPLLVSTLQAKRSDRAPLRKPHTGSHNKKNEIWNGPCESGRRNVDLRMLRSTGVIVTSNLLVFTFL